jgi:prevent-host-death family protein
VDLFAVYCGELDRCFLLPAQPLVSKTCASLRLTSPRNGQRSCINLADDFAFDGAVAQLARARDWQSRGRGFESPQLHSQTAPQTPTAVNADDFRIGLGRWIDRVSSGEDLLVTRRGKPVMRVTAPLPALVPPNATAEDLCA